MGEVTEPRSCWQHIRGLQINPRDEVLELNGPSHQHRACVAKRKVLVTAFIILGYTCLLL